MEREILKWRTENGWFSSVNMTATRTSGINREIGAVGDDHGGLETLETVCPEIGWVTVEDVGGIGPQRRPGSLAQFNVQLTGRPSCHACEYSKGFGRLGLGDEALQQCLCPDDIDSVNDRFDVGW